MSENNEEIVSEEIFEGEELTPAQIIKKIEEEGDIAADYLEEFLDIIDMDGDLDIDVDHGRASLAIVTEEEENLDLEELVGQDGKVLDAIQELTRLAVQTKTGDRSRIMLDIAGYRAKKRAFVAEIAANAIAECKETNKPVHMEAMNPFERKVVHDTVADAGLISDSEGVAPNRHVVIYPNNEVEA